MCSATSNRKREPRYAGRSNVRHNMALRKKSTCRHENETAFEKKYGVSHTDGKCGALRRSQRRARRDRSRLRHGERGYSFAFQDLQGFLQPVDLLLALAFQLLVAVAKRGPALLPKVLQIRDDGSKL